MAGDWIPMRLDLHDDPAVMAIADATGLDLFGVVGRLHRIWSWANQQLENGHAASVTLLRLDALVGVTNFAQSMVDTGWLIATSTGVAFPKFETWNSQSAKRRLLALRRKRAQRDRIVSRECHANSVTKRRENRERSNTPHSPPLGSGSTVQTPTLFERFWSAYPRKVAKPRAFAAWQKLKPTEELLTKILAALEWQRTSEQWTRDGGQFVPHPATWLNARRWEDEKPTPGTKAPTRLDPVTQYARDTFAHAAGLEEIP